MKTEEESGEIQGLEKEEEERGKEKTEEKE